MTRSTFVRLALAGAIAVIGIAPTLAQAPRNAQPRAQPKALQQQGARPKGAQPPTSGLPQQAQPKAAPPALRAGFNLPPANETRFVRDEVMLDIPASVPTPTLDEIAARHTMTRLETQSFGLTGRTLHRWRLDGGGTVQSMIRGLARERLVLGAQPNYIYALMQDALVPPNSNQYAPAKLDLIEAPKLATGDRVSVAVIDSGVDPEHPDLAGAITASFDAAGDGVTPHQHGTGMAGAIAARRTMLGTAPRVALLAARAFNSKTSNTDGTTFSI